MTKTCNSCKQSKHEKYFGANRHGNPLATCRKCLAEQKKEQHEEKAHKPVYTIHLRLAAWLDNHARMPNRKGQVQTIRGYDCAGMDEGNLIRGNAIEHVTNPLFGNPMYVAPPVQWHLIRKEE